MTENRLDHLRQLSSAFGQFGEDYIFASIKTDRHGLDFLTQPVRVSGVTICLVLQGNMSVSLNDNVYEVTANSLLTFSSSNVVKLCDVKGEKINIYLLFISSQFLQDLNIDVNSINLHTLVEQGHQPVIKSLTEPERVFMAENMHLLYHNATYSDDSLYKKNISRSLIQALLYHQLLIRANRATAISQDISDSNGRRNIYVHDFMRLVQLHHRRERSLDFYADKLYITPKYLSRIIKESTGRSAAEWIDDFVIAEAKNLLRFSNKNIQQIAYELNFTTQSSFGKFFKHLTGMSPSQYQKT